MNRSRRLAPLLLGAALVGTAFFLLLPGSDAGMAPLDGVAQQAKGPAPRAVRVAPVASALDDRDVTVSGTTRATKRAEVSFQIGGRIESRPVDVGDRVARGALLATLDGRAWRHESARAAATVAELDARLAQARRDLARVTTLFEARAATAEEVEQVEASERALASSRDAAAAVADEARRLVEETALRAPFAGIVREVRLEPGEYAEPGVPVVLVDGEGATELEVEVPEWAAGRVTAGARVPVTLPFASAAPVVGVIRSVGRTSGGAGRLFPVVIALTSPAPIPPGTTAEATLRIDGEATLAVPLRAVLNPGGSDATVFRIANGKAERVRVTPSRILGEMVSVRGPLGTGDQVVIAGQASLAHGDEVSILH